MDVLGTPQVGAVDAARPNDSVRPFGTAGDLDVDFEQADRPGLVTELLARCDGAGDAAFWWNQPVSARTGALLRVVAATEQRGDLSLNARCVAGACNERFEFELPLYALARAASEVGPLRVRLDDARTLAMRRPTGSDLRRWRDAEPASRSEAVGAMLASLLLEGQVDAGDEAAVSSALGALDPLVDFAVACRCPACGAPNEIRIDLEALALTRLAARQRALVHEVHRFASRYGWTESVVLAVPPARRARYLALMADQS
jgi:hypothetical protein